jgi:hypothetical protein
MALDPDDVKNHRREQERRGKRPIDISAKRRRLILLKKFKEALEANDVEAFKEAIIHDLGQLPGTPAYNQSLKTWYEFHGTS